MEHSDKQSFHLDIGKTHAPRKTAGQHCHPYGQIILNISGDGFDEVGGKNVPIRAGSITFVPAGMMHGKYSAGGFEDIFVSCNDIGWNNSVFLHDDEAETVRRLMETLYFLFYQNEKKITPSQLFVYRALIELLKEKLNLRNINPLSETIRARIINGFSDPELTVDKVMAGIPYCADHARRIFKQEYGISPRDYMISLRMDKAAGMLTGGNTSIADVALCCGYYDQSYFSRVFRKFYGMTPNQYAKMSEKS